MCRFLINNTCLPYNWKRTKAFWVILWRGTSQMRVWFLLCQGHQMWLYKSLGIFVLVSSFQNPSEFLYRQIQEQLGELHLLTRRGAIYRNKKTTTFFILGLFYTRLTNLTMLTVEIKQLSMLSTHHLRFALIFWDISLSTSAISEKCLR